MSRVSKEPTHLERMAQALRRAITEAGISQKELARRADIGYSTLAKYVAGSRAPEGEILERLVQALGKHGHLLTDVIPNHIVDRQLETVLVRAVRLLMQGQSMVDAMETITGGEVSKEGKASLSGRSDALRDEVRRAALQLFDQFYDALSEEQERVIARMVIQWTQRQ